MAVVLLLSSCQGNTEYYTYEGVPADGWEKSDTLFFHIDSIRQSGQYSVRLCLRTNQDYPYRNLALKVVEKHLRTGQVTPFKLTTDVRNADGTQTGKGVSLFVKEMELDRLMLQQGDSLLFQVRHDMTREAMPGIVDIGIRLDRVQ